VAETITCPSCNTTIRHAAEFRPSMFTYVLTMQDGRGLPARLLGESMADVARLLRLTAKGLGVKAEVFVYDVKIEGQTASVELAILPVARSGELSGEALEAALKALRKEADHAE